MDNIKILRDETGLSFAQIKKALDEVGGDMNMAREKLKEYSVKQAEKRGENATGAGAVASYIHSNNSLGAMIVLSCETDFVSNNDEYKNIAKDIAMHVCAMGNDNIEEVLNEPFVKDGERTVQEIINSAIQKFGENIKLTKATRFTL